MGTQWSITFENSITNHTLYSILFFVLVEILPMYLKAIFGLELFLTVGTTKRTSIRVNHQVFLILGSAEEALATVTTGEVNLTLSMSVASVNDHLVFRVKGGTAFGTGHVFWHQTVPLINMHVERIF